MRLKLAVSPSKDNGKGGGAGEAGRGGNFPGFGVGVCDWSLRNITQFYNPVRVILDPYL